jgi:DNA-binding IclR family transcriptional regulator
MSVFFDPSAALSIILAAAVVAVSYIMDTLRREGVMSAPRTQSVPALERGLSILESLSKSKHGLTLSQLSRALELPKSSVHCLLLTFERHGYLHHDDSSGRYRLGLRFCDLANAALGGVMLRDQAAPFLRQLRESTQLTTHMAVLEHDEVVLIEKLEAPSARVNSWIGKRMDVHCTALGKALTAALPEEQLDVLVHRHGLLRHNDNTIASIKKLAPSGEFVGKSVARRAVEYAPKRLLARVS